MKKLLLSAIVILGFTAVSFGQTNQVANATATAKVIKALTLTNPTGLDFGTFSGLSTTTSTVVLATNNSRSGTANLLAGLPGTAAAFNVVGEANAVFSITLPATATSLTAVAPSLGTAMSIPAASWVTNQTSNSSVTLDGSGLNTFLVGSTLNVGINQAAGTYNGTYSVTVNYN